MLAIEFRLLPKYGVRNLQAIVINYFTCFMLGSILLGESAVNKHTFTETWFPFALFLSLTFITFFNVNALTIQKVGMIITSIFQKLSLVFPTMVGLMFYNESGGTTKYIAIPLTVIAIVLSNYPDKNNISAIEKMKKYWYLPILVFLGSGLIEVLLYYVQKSGKIGEGGLAFTSTLFFFAGCFGLLFMLGIKKFNFTFKEILAGIGIGIPNFFTIYLIIKGLEIGIDGSVLFPMNNVGTIFLTSVAGIILFKEKLTSVNYLGLLLAIIAVFLISM